MLDPEDESPFAFPVKFILPSGTHRLRRVTQDSTVDELMLFVGCQSSATKAFTIACTGDNPASKMWRISPAINKKLKDLGITRPTTFTVSWIDDNEEMEENNSTDEKGSTFVDAGTPSVQFRSTQAGVLPTIERPPPTLSVTSTPPVLKSNPPSQTHARLIY
ncbi:uncharacterized protein [Apostichopus japonicus]|uniref:uncharacterized protein n=1 Tax=Stichopus japonicus TaxID=307972 RepID=UPI003AB8F591